MRLQRPPPRAPMETIIAMIDVVFFLLVFFMLIGRMDASAPFEVAPPLGRGGTDLPTGGVIIAVAPDGRHALDGVELGADEIIAALTARASDDPAVPVRVNAHHSAPLSLVLPLLARLEAVGIADIGLVVTPVPP